MADTNIDATRKQKRAERTKRYKLKRKIEMQKQASAASETETSETELAKSRTCHTDWLCIPLCVSVIFFFCPTNPCDMYKSCLRHIHDPEFLSQDRNNTCNFFFS